jgi:hypothetical protein
MLTKKMQEQESDTISSDENPKGQVECNFHYKFG